MFGFKKNKRTIKVYKDFLVLFSGSVIGQFIVFVSIPYFTRVYSQEVFGVFALYSSVVAILSLISTLRYELAIMLPKEDGDAVNVLALNLIVISVMSSLVFIFIAIFKNYLLNILNINNFGNYILLIPVSVMLVGVINALDSWNNRKGNYISISTGVVSKSSTMVSSQFITSISMFSSLGLIPGLIIGQIVNFGVSIKLTFKTFKTELKYISCDKIILLAKRYKDMPRFNTIISFTNTLSNELPVIMLSSLFGLNVVGVYGLAVKFSKALPGIIGLSISKIFYKEMTSVYNAGEGMFALVIRTYKNLLRLSLIVFTPIYIGSYYLVYLFGENWIEVGVYVRLLLPWIVIMFMNSPISSITVILNKQKFMLVLDLLLVILRATALVMGYTLFNDIYYSLLFFSLVGFMFNAFILLYYLYLSHSYNKLKGNHYS